MKRLLDSTASEIQSMNKEEKLVAMQASEGRTIVSEMTTSGAPEALPNASLGELYAAFGSDALLLNMFDVYQPKIQQLEAAAEDTIKELKRLTGKLVGVNLEPVATNHEMAVDQNHLSEGRLANVATAQRAYELGVDFILLTGNPDTGVTNQAIIQQVQQIHQKLGDKLIIIAGKMHAAGSLTESGTKIITKSIIESFCQAGADIILLPAPGTVPGITLEQVHELVDFTHSIGKLTMTAIGTSQEDSDPSVIREIALMCKITGTDLHHIGDAGYAGAVPESIMNYSIAIRGKRHTYNRMATSVLR